METTQICNNCKESKQQKEFRVHKTTGIIKVCSECEIKQCRERRKTKQGVISAIYGSQISSTKKRNHSPIAYTNKILSEWLLNDWTFNMLYDNWVNCGYKRAMKPSVDRIDDSKGYSFDNIRLVTWKENDSKGHYNRKNAITTQGSLCKAVIQYDLNMNKISEYHSISEASRQTSSMASKISLCCKGERGKTNGFKWKYKSDIML